MASDLLQGAPPFVGDSMMSFAAQVLSGRRSPRPRGLSPIGLPLTMTTPRWSSPSTTWRSRTTLWAPGLVRALHERGLAISERVLGPDHPTVV